MSRYGTPRPWLGWYKLKRWLDRRAHQLAHEPLCRMCLEQEIVTEANTADHVKPHRGDPELFWHGKLQSLCSQCHSKHKQNEETGKTVVRYGADGWPI